MKFFVEREDDPAGDHKPLPDAYLETHDYGTCWTVNIYNLTNLIKIVEGHGAIELSRTKIVLLDRTDQEAHDAEVRSHPVVYNLPNQGEGSVYKEET